MDKKRVIKTSLIILNFLIIATLIWSIVNYKVLNNEVTRIVQIWGIIAFVLIIIFLEGAPVVVGPSVAIATILAMDGFNVWFVFALFLASVIIGNILYFYLGVYSGKKIFKYFDQKDIKKYEKIFSKHGRIAMLTTAISPIPYCPTLAGAFKMSKYRMFVETMGLRIIGHIIVFFILFALLGKL